MDYPTAATQHYRSQQALAATTLRAADRLWRQVGVEFDAGWDRVGAELVALVNGAMVDAAQGGIDYLPRVLDETGQSSAGLATVSASAFAGYTREGVVVAEALHASVRISKQAVADGHTPSGALLQGRKSLQRLIPSLIADADRGAVQVGLTTTKVGGYVRMLVGPSCKDCIMLAGRWYAWNEGFQRHPHCDCRHIPASENIAGDWRTDPYQAFNQLSEEEQDRRFGKSEARAIRDGADMYRVVNVKTRGLPSAKAFRSPRMTVDEIYRTAGTRARAVEMLTQQGYILPGGQVAGGVIAMDAKVAHALGGGALGRGGTRVGATYAHQKAAMSGVRDPRERATQTAAERRLHDAVLRAQAAADGRNPYGRGKLTAAAKTRAEAELDTEIRILTAGLDPESGIRPPKQVYTLADLLGVKYR